MLESMIEGTFPTRAEVTDVSNAVYECTDATMLSAETAGGKYPLEAAAMMDKIIRASEGDPNYHNYIREFTYALDNSKHQGDAIAKAVADIASKVDAKAVVAYTTSGSTAINISKHRPNAPIVAMAPNDQVAGRVGFCWGVIPILDTDTSSPHMDTLAKKAVLDLGLAKEGDLIVVTFGKDTNGARAMFENPAATIISVIKV
jgi:pyruvate kinase